jgi:hypothetical protein
MRVLSMIMSLATAASAKLILGETAKPIRATVNDKVGFNIILGETGINSRSGRPLTIRWGELFELNKIIGNNLNLNYDDMAMMKFHEITLIPQVLIPHFKIPNLRKLKHSII